MPRNDGATQATVCEADKQKREMLLDRLHSPQTLHSVDQQSGSAVPAVPYGTGVTGGTAFPVKYAEFLRKESGRDSLH